MKTVIIDVRTQKEFKDGSYPGALNMPSGDFNPNSFLPYKENHIALVCFSGNRAGKIQSKLFEVGFTNVSVMEHQMANILEGPKKKESIWTVDRQFRLVLSILIGISLIGTYLLSSPAYLSILFIIVAGLLYSAITDNCYLKALIGAMPWNKETSEKSTEQEFIFTA